MVEREWRSVDTLCLSVFLFTAGFRSYLQVELRVSFAYLLMRSGSSTTKPVLRSIIIGFGKSSLFSSTNVPFFSTESTGSDKRNRFISYHSYFLFTTLHYQIISHRVLIEILIALADAVFLLSLCLPVIFNSLAGEGWWLGVYFSLF